jgi:hypothetical protein
MGQLLRDSRRGCRCADRPAVRGDDPDRRTSPSRAVEADAAFGTPTIVHFSAALLLSAILVAPWQTITIGAIAPEIIGVIGALCVIVVARRIHVQRAYEPEFEDWIFHALLPFTAYGILAAAAFLIGRYPRDGLFGVGGGTLLLLFIGIHNAWDSVAYLVFVSRQKMGDRKADGE